VILDLVRHGHAMASGPDGDASRSLSERGRQEVARLARALVKHGWRPERTFASPLLRARETAALLSEMASVPAAEILEELAPDVKPSEALGALASSGARGHVLLVSHLPLLDLLVQGLTGESHGLDPATLIRIEVDEGIAEGRGRATLRLHPSNGSA
jgi:phosphohistidine phosphatase SixA